MLSEIAKDKEYLRAAEIIQKAERNGRRLGFYEPDKEEYNLSETEKYFQRLTKRNNNGKD